MDGDLIELQNERVSEPEMVYGIPRAGVNSDALRTNKVYSGLPKETCARLIGNQLLRSGTSVGAQYCEALRARSKVEFVSRIESALQEIEETNYWLELLVEAEIVNERQLAGLMAEFLELNPILQQQHKRQAKHE